MKTLSYNDLKTGTIYTTSYPNQGTYIFKQGYPLWMSVNYGTIQYNNNGNLTPTNGFTEFKKATKKEIAMLMPTSTKGKSPIVKDITRKKTINDIVQKLIAMEKLNKQHNALLQEITELIKDI